MIDILIYGTSGHARVVVDAARRTGTYRILGLVVDGSNQPNEFAGLPVLGGREVLSSMRKSGCANGFVAVGANPARVVLAQRMEDAGFEMTSIIHPSAIVANDVKLGSGVFLAAGTVVNAAAEIGDLVIINTSSSVDHDCVVERAAHLSPGARLGGHVRIGEGAWVGMGATVLDRRVIGAWSIVGGGAVVTHDVPPHRIFAGVAARDIGPSHSHSHSATKNPAET